VAPLWAGRVLVLVVTSARGGLPSGRQRPQKTDGMGKKKRGTPQRLKTKNGNVDFLNHPEGSEREGAPNPTNGEEGYWKEGATRKTPYTLLPKRPVVPKTVLNHIDRRGRGCGRGERRREMVEAEIHTGGKTRAAEAAFWRYRGGGALRATCSKRT